MAGGLPGGPFCSRGARGRNVLAPGATGTLEASPGATRTELPGPGCRGARTPRPLCPGRTWPPRAPWAWACRSKSVKTVTYDPECPAPPRSPDSWRHRRGNRPARRIHFARIVRPLFTDCGLASAHNIEIAYITGVALSHTPPDFSTARLCTLAADLLPCRPFALRFESALDRQGEKVRRAWGERAAFVQDASFRSLFMWPVIGRRAPLPQKVRARSG
jgi:hypothetical protein